MAIMGDPICKHGHFCPGICSLAGQEEIARARAEGVAEGMEKCARLCEIEAVLGGEKQNQLSGAKLASMIRAAAQGGDDDKRNG